MQDKVVGLFVKDCLEIIPTRFEKKPCRIKNRIVGAIKLEVLEKDGYYHIYNRGINGCLIFESDENKSFFLKQFSKYLWGKISIFGYCLMDNHFHLVIRLNEDEEIVTQAFSNFFNSYVKAFNKDIGRTGSLFEKHFKRIRLHDEEYLRQLILYVHLNPKHHLDLKFEYYKYSSYQAFMSDKETKMEREEVLRLFGGLENFIFCHNQRNDFLTEKFTFEYIRTKCLLQGLLF